MTGRPRGDHEDVVGNGEPLRPAKRSWRTVWFLGVPVATYLRLQERNDAVMRECSLVLIAPDTETIPPRLLELAAILPERLAAFQEQYRGEVERAVAEGRPRTDLWAEAPLSLAGDADRFLALMEELDGFCRAGAFIAEPPDEETIVLRRWFVEQAKAQLTEGAPPTPFPGG
ncbi:MAG TPA: hypothetical protein VE152_03140 [Acidimicrobiales bacterium]|jgi:hypothetical protein|nr:hypothetical protein [Acidimicrobiales bacterium]